MIALFTSWRKATVDAALATRKASSEDDNADGATAGIEAGADFVTAVTPLLAAAHKAGSIDASAQLGLDATNLANEQAIAWAKERAAELVGMRYDEDGELVENPDAEYAIDDATRSMLRQSVTDAMENGVSNDKLAGIIADAYAFSDERAERIARTETAFADVAGNLQAWSDSGQVGKKQWLTADGCCDDCEALDGVTVDLDDDFPDGGDGPPLHPDCRCDVVPVLTAAA